MKLKILLNTFLINFILPRSKDKDRVRREFILNILLSGLIILSGIAFFVTLFGPLLNPKSSTTESPVIIGVILFFFCALFVMPRLGKSNISANLFILLLYLVGIYSDYQYGAELAEGLLLSALLIVMAGILINTRAALLITVLTGCSIIFFSYLEINNLYHPDIAWENRPILITDSIVFVITLGIIATVSWLFNRESEKALKRARQSEIALTQQRDQLEVLVENRTKLLKKTQLESIEQMYRFAEFGQIAAGLIHDLTTPLNVVSLNLTKISRHKPFLVQSGEITDIETSLKRARIGTKFLEKFLLAARKQIQNQEITKNFSISSEINQVIQILDYQAKGKQVKIDFIHSSNIRTIGNPIKFSQAIANLLLNAIDSYDRVEMNNRLVAVSLRNEEGRAILTIEDWGKGIHKRHLTRVFEPLFTTKSAELDIGIGLSITKKIIENNFGGKIYVSSKHKKGSVFTIELPLHPN